MYYITVNIPFSVNFAFFLFCQSNPSDTQLRHGRVTGLLNAKTKKANYNQNNKHFQTALRIYMHTFLKLEIIIAANKL